MIDFFFISEMGDHQPNEDSVKCVCREDGYLFALADGLGGHGFGEVASALVTEKSAELFMEYGGGELYLDSAFMESQEALLKKQSQNNCIGGMKTTLVLFTVDSEQLRWGHIGDSRLYYFRNHRLISRTIDHSVPQALVLSHRLKEKNIRNHPDRNRLLRVMGTEWETSRYELDGSILRNEGKHQDFLICTDGFWELIEEKEMLKCLKTTKTAKEWITAMTEIVKERGRSRKMDNYSAIGVRMI